MSDFRSFLPPELARLMSQQAPAMPQLGQNRESADFLNGLVNSPLFNSSTALPSAADPTAFASINQGAGLGSIAKSLLAGANGQAGTDLGSVLAGK